MSSETEKRVENLLGGSGGTVSVNNYPGASSQMVQKPHVSDMAKPPVQVKNDTRKERLHSELKQRQESQKVRMTYLKWLIVVASFSCFLHVI